MEETNVTKLMARSYYLKKLQGFNLVTPSINRPFPHHPASMEDMIIHNSMMQIQRIRSRKLAKEVKELINNGHSVNDRMYEQLKKKFDEKITHLREKFNPYYQHTNKSSRKRERNKRNRERYKSRKMNKEIDMHAENNKDTVINLSSHPLDKVEKYVLGLGHGFVPTPNNSQKEEEVLILEGLRVTDRIRKLDKELMKDTIEPARQEEGFTREELEEIFNNSTNESFHGFTEEETPSRFARSKQIPQYLRYS